MNALEPHISEKTLSFHYGKHHQGYVNKLNELVANTPFSNMSLEEVIEKSHQKNAPIFNNVAQVWNHTFYWESMTPKGAKQPTSKLASLIQEAFGGLEGFNQKFKEAATTQFSSGWAWLTYTRKRAMRKHPLHKPALNPYLPAMCGSMPII